MSASADPMWQVRAADRAAKNAILQRQRIKAMLEAERRQRERLIRDRPTGQSDWSPLEHEYPQDWEPVFHEHPA